MLTQCPVIGTRCLPASIAFNEAGPEQGSAIKFAPPASVPMKPIEATVAAAVGGRPGRSPRLSGAPLVRSARPWAPPSPVERQR